MTSDRGSNDSHSDKDIVVSPQGARSGVISGRVLLVLVISLMLALIAMAVLLPYFYDADGSSH